ncbi:hypothetical protein QBC34DRAFT_475673 [Podospora aff. communis PSN243]|uniref:EamA domain-containing protein n=1 Tax=Podospora aff. communis PSN243 TaxID=3040156 RepID=A0AAV9GYE3_9PEZI|nr:hypothetical protein QBC34DRAFT_475673 [Podospora aff. communis PSN243]
MPHESTTSHLQIPQTPRSKTRFEDSDDEDFIDGLQPFQDAGYRKATGSSLVTPVGLRSRSVSPYPESGHRAPAQHRTPSVAAMGYQTGEFSFWDITKRLWDRNRGVILVGVAQLFGATMNLCTRLLELDEEHAMHPFQILFFRMSITTGLSMIYMYYTNVPHFPLGSKDVRLLLVLRGTTGFFGIYGMWWSMMYLPLAEATVITFLAPAFTGYICHLLLKDPYTKKEQIASFLALIGVVLIARPTSFFGGSETPSTTGPPATPGDNTASPPQAGEDSPASQRLIGVGIAMIGVLGASGAYTFIRWIGKRAHPLISVTYFSVWSTIVSTTALLLAPPLDIGQPGIKFALPASAFQWMLLLSLGLCGFIMQFMLTSGIGGRRSNKAMAMVYTHMLFAAGYDRWVFGHEMGMLSLVGCGLIVGSALWAALSKKDKEEKHDAEQGVGNGGVEMEEGVPMLRRGGGEEILLGYNRLKLPRGSRKE